MKEFVNFLLMIIAIIAWLMFIAEDVPIWVPLLANACQILNLIYIIAKK